MKKHELNNQVEANVFSDELTDEALDRAQLVALLCPRCMSMPSPE